jgi:histidine triad (HIT) family protein
MYNHEPEGYVCPFCLLANGFETGTTGQADVVYRDELVTALISLHWRENNPGHVLVVPTTHHEHVYDLPPELGTPLQRVVRDVALAMKMAYGCDGVSIAQNNEPRGGQDVWHYHVHVFPRYQHDNFHGARWGVTTAEERLPYAERLREALRTSRETIPVGSPALTGVGANQARPRTASSTCGCDRAVCSPVVSPLPTCGCQQVRAKASTDRLGHMSVRAS